MLKITSSFTGYGKELSREYTRLLQGVTPTDHAPQMINLSTVLKGSILTAYVRQWIGNRDITDVPATSLEASLILNTVGPRLIIMGRRAFDLAGYKMQRTHTLRVLTGDPDEKAFEGDGATHFVGSPVAALENLPETRHGPAAWLWGGARTYAALLPYCDHVVALKTRGAGRGSNLFPQLLPTDWTQTHNEAVPQVAGEDRAFILSVHKRK